MRPGFLAFRVTGKDADMFRHEAGGHRWQRIPATEKKGRVHTSTVTVATLREPTATEIRVLDRDIDWKTCRGSGAGGQHRNVTDSAVQLTHKPSGIQIRVEAGRSQHQNKELALGLLRAKLGEVAETAKKGKRDAKRKSQVGSGMRGDKRRTIALQRGEVTDHVTGKRLGAKQYLRGEVDLLW